VGEGAYESPDCFGYPGQLAGPGSVGLPRDSGGKANYAVYEQGSITLKQVTYDVEATIADLRRGPLSKAVMQRLAALLHA
jgi:hypothetical protein